MPLTFFKYSFNDKIAKGYHKQKYYTILLNIITHFHLHNFIATTNSTKLN